MLVSSRSPGVLRSLWRSAAGRGSRPRVIDDVYGESGALHGAVGEAGEVRWMR